jgi:hypothetical protein
MNQLAGVGITHRIAKISHQDFALCSAKIAARTASIGDLIGP